MEITSEPAITATEAVAQLDALVAARQRREYRDVEGMHVAADGILYAAVAPEVREAYDRVVDAAGDWWYA